QSPICTCSLLFHCPRPLRLLPSFPTRRSSDLPGVEDARPRMVRVRREAPGHPLVGGAAHDVRVGALEKVDRLVIRARATRLVQRSEEHTSELQSRGHLVCRLLLEKKKKRNVQI